MEALQILLLIHQYLKNTSVALQPWMISADNAYPCFFDPEPEVLYTMNPGQVFSLTRDSRCLDFNQAWYLSNIYWPRRDGRLSEPCPVRSRILDLWHRSLMLWPLCHWSSIHQHQLHYKSKICTKVNRGDLPFFQVCSILGVRVPF